MDFLDQQLQAQLHERHDVHRARHLRALPSSAIDLGSNDYLGLSRHPHVTTSVRIAAEDYGASARASRLLGGDCKLHTQLEQVLAAWKSHPNSPAQSALLFSSGYAANLGVITALARRGDAIFCDKRNHASLIDACRLAENAGATVRFYHSKEKLIALLENVVAPRRLILSDTVYSMNGDLADLPQLLQIAHENEAILVLDDAHGSGTLGANGQGALHHFYPENLPDELPPIVQIGTLSKALGAQGGFVVASPLVIEWLLNAARSFVYSTGLSPVVCGAALAALQVLAWESQRLQCLRDNTEFLGDGLRVLGFAVPKNVTPILPIVAGDEARALRWSEQLLARNIWCPAVRPPTVARGTSRLRLTVHSELSPEEIERALNAFATLK